MMVISRILNHVNLARFGALLAIGALCAPPSGWSAVGALVPKPGFVNGAGLSVSYGEGISESSRLYGWSADYSRTLTDDQKWAFSTSLSWDRDTVRKSGPDEVSDTYSLVFAVTRMVAENVYVGAGIAKGFLERKIEPDKKGWESIAIDKDWGTGILITTTLWSRGRHQVSPAATLEYSLSDNKWSWSMDLGWSVAF